MPSNSSTRTQELVALDPLLARVELPLEATFYPCGYAVCVKTNSARILDAARQSWPTGERMFSEPPVELRVLVSEDGSTALPAPPVFRAQGHMLGIAADAANFAICDLKAGFAACWLGSAAARDAGYVRWYFLEAMAYCILEQLHCTSIHAACVVFEGQGVLLPGGPGAGKSCLAYACVRRGWTYLCDDSCFLQRRSEEPVVLGLAHQIRFRDTAVSLFPELAGRPVFVRGEGKPSIELSAAGLATTRIAVVRYVVFLDRQDAGPGRLLRLPAEEVLDRLESELRFYEEEAFRQKKAALRSLLAAEACELRYSNLDAAVHRLEQLVCTRG